MLLTVADPGCGERGGGARPVVGAGTWGKYRQAKKKEKKRKEKGLQQTKEKKHPLRHTDRGALECAGPVAYATFATRFF